MADLRVIGAGVAGSVLARTARDAGLAVEVVSDPAAARASICAVGLLRRLRSPAAPAPEVYDEAVAWYSAHGMIHGDLGPTAVTSWRTPGVRCRPGDCAVNVDEVLVTPDVSRRWDPAEPDDVPTVIATGASGGHLPGQLRWGATLLSNDHLDGLAEHLLGPRRSIHAVTANGLRRSGSSMAKDATTALERLARGLDAAGWPTDGIVRVGVRLMGNGLGNVIWHVGPRRWAIGGFGRSGFTLAPQTARRTLELVTAAS